MLSSFKNYGISKIFFKITFSQQVEMSHNGIKWQKNYVKSEIFLFFYL